MEHNITSKELSGRDSAVVIKNIVPLSAITSEYGLIAHFNLIMDLSKTNMTEHASMKHLRFPDLNDMSEALPVQKKLPKTGFIVNLWCMWSLLESGDIEVILESHEISNEKTRFINEGYVYVDDLSDIKGCQDKYNEWAQIQTNKIFELREQITELSRKDYHDEDTLDGFAGRLAGLAVPHI